MLGRQFAPLLQAAKSSSLTAGLAWYPYDTLANLSHISTLMKNDLSEFVRALQAGPVIDIGCADGDLGMFFASLGLDTTCVDNPPTNYNRMCGVNTLRERLGFDVDVVQRDVDSQFSLPKTYGLAITLGILYHLKNPFYFLETIARHAHYCVLSTRIAEETTRGTPMGNETLAYLLDAGESNADATNYWVFSPTAMRLLARRAGWSIVREVILGCVENSNPVDSDRDGRVFLLLQSRRLSLPARVDLINGWTEVSNFDSGWTLKRFSLRATLQDSLPPTRFALEFYLIPELIARSPVVLSCKVNGLSVGVRSFDRAGTNVFEADISPSAANANDLLFEFTAEHEFESESDRRDLGVIVPFAGGVGGTSHKLHFWLG